MTSRNEFEPMSMTPTRPLPPPEISRSIARLLRRGGLVVEDESGRRVGAVERGAAAAGEAGVGHEIGVRAERILADRVVRVDAVGAEMPALRGVLQIGHDD